MRGQPFLSLVPRSYFFLSLNIAFARHSSHSIWTIKITGEISTFVLELVGRVLFFLHCLALTTLTPSLPLTRVIDNLPIVFTISLFPWTFHPVLVRFLNADFHFSKIELHYATHLYSFFPSIILREATSLKQAALFSDGHLSPRDYAEYPREFKTASSFARLFYAAKL